MNTGCQVGTAISEYSTAAQMMVYVRHPGTMALFGPAAQSSIAHSDAAMSLVQSSPLLRGPTFLTGRWGSDAGPRCWIGQFTALLGVATQARGVRLSRS